MQEIHSFKDVRLFMRLKAKMINFVQRNFPKLYEKINIIESKKWKVNSIPWTPLKKALSESNVALVTSGGIITKEQVPFDLNDLNGDCSYREIQSNVQIDQIVISHMYYDHSDIRVDTEVMFPLNTLKRIQAEGMIGKVNHRHFSFSGGVNNPTPLINQTAPEVAKMLVSDQVDLVLLTPA